MREEGYYFVKLHGNWEIAKFYKLSAGIDSKYLGFWNSLDWDVFRCDDHFDEIGSKIELPKTN
jgi:hypothetical protein